MAKSIFFHVDKIKSPAALGRRCIHYTRKKHNETHIDYSLTGNNKYFVGNENDSFNQLFKEKEKSLPYYSNHTRRKDGVMAFDILASFPEEVKNDELQKKLEIWEKRTSDYILKKFGKDNVVNMVLHLDEPDSNPHIHAIAFPVYQGKFVSKAFIDGPPELRKIQTEYADLFEDIGYDRGISDSQTKHQGGKKIQEIKKKAFSHHAPEVRDGETAEQYRNRIDEEWNELQSSSMIKDNTIKRQGDLREIDKRKDKRIREQDRTLDELREENVKLKTELHEKKIHDYALKHGISIYPEGEREKLQRVYDLLSDVAERGREDLKMKGIDIDVEVER